MQTSNNNNPYDLASKVKLPELNTSISLSKETIIDLIVAIFVLVVLIILVIKLIK
jgi:hypothetical protein